MARLRAQDGGPVLVTGSRPLVHTLLGSALVDELRLMVFPVTVGSGARVFPETTRKTAWRLVDTRPFPSGVRVDTYRARLTGGRRPRSAAARRGRPRRHVLR